MPRPSSLSNHGNALRIFFKLLAGREPPFDHSHDRINVVERSRMRIPFQMGNVKHHDLLMRQVALVGLLFGPVRPDEEDALDTATLNVAAHRLENLIHDRRAALAVPNSNEAPKARLVESIRNG
jgi:hypothetical protein